MRALCQSRVSGRPLPECGRNAACLKLGCFRVRLLVCPRAGCGQPKAWFRGLGTLRAVQSCRMTLESGQNKPRSSGYGLGRAALLHTTPVARLAPFGDAVVVRLRTERLSELVRAPLAHLVRTCSLEGPSLVGLSCLLGTEAGVETGPDRRPTQPSRRTSARFSVVRTLADAPLGRELGLVRL